MAAATSDITALDDGSTTAATDPEPGARSDDAVWGDDDDEADCVRPFFEDISAGKAVGLFFEGGDDLDEAHSIE